MASVLNTKLGFHVFTLRTSPVLNVSVIKTVITKQEEASKAQRAQVRNKCIEYQSPEKPRSRVR
jgi:hypothetical protein